MSLLKGTTTSFNIFYNTVIHSFRRYQEWDFRSLIIFDYESSNVNEYFSRIFVILGCTMYNCTMWTVSNKHSGWRHQANKAAAGIWALCCNFKIKVNKFFLQIINFIHKSKLKAIISKESNHKKIDLKKYNNKELEPI